MITSAKHNTILIAVVGPNGVGKTTIAKSLSMELGAKALLEDLTNLPSLADFYQDPSTFAYEAEIELTVNHSTSLIETLLKRKDQTLVTDHNIEIDRIYAQLTLHNQPKKMASYMAIWKALKRALIPASYILLVDAPVDILLERIRGRGRSEEQGITHEYLTEIRDRILSEVQRFDSPHIRIVNGSDLDSLMSEIPTIASEIRREIDSSVATG